jgi:hypothetical protein
MGKYEEFKGHISYNVRLWDCDCTVYSTDVLDVGIVTVQFTVLMYWM